MTCSNCGQENVAGAAFCGNCGTALASGPPTAPGGPTEPIPPIPPVPPSQAPTDPTLVGGMPAAPPPVPPTDATAVFGAPPPGPPPMAAPPAKEKSRKSLLIGLIALLVVAAAVASFFVLSGDDEAGAAEIVLEPIGLSIEDDFAGDLDLRSFDSSIANVLPDAPPIGSGIASALSGLQADGDTPGLYGGTRDAGTCDVEQLVSFLTDEENSEKAEAWADALGIDVGDIEDFVAELTPVRLRFDTRVTNHGFVDGEANPFQSILEAGTAVLVDDEGVPRVKCNCGNPLAEPEDLGDVSEDDALDEDLIQNPDVAWDGFDPEQVVTVDPGDQLDEFVLVDIDSGEIFVRPVGTDGDEDTDVDPDAVCELLGSSPTCQEEPEPPDDTTTTTNVDDTTTTSIELGTGDVQVTLRWGSDADLDLVVIDPNGEEASRSSTTSTGGQLDVDSNIGCQNDGSVENVFWPEGQAPLGEYTIVVEGFQVGDSCGSGDYEITVRTTGQGDQTFTGTVEQSAESRHTFRVG
jgi:hypothetical protein